MSGTSDTPMLRWRVNSAFSLEVATNWKRNPESRPVVVLPPDGDSVIQISSLQSEPRATSKPVRLLAIGAVHKWRDAGPDGGPKMLTVREQPYDFADSTAIWVEAPPNDTLTPNDRAFGIGWRD
jgi:hypothetical protein